MTHKDDIEMRRAATLKAARSFIRLKWSIAADEELNEVLPRVQMAFDTAVQHGELPEVKALLHSLLLDEA